MGGSTIEKGCRGARGRERGGGRPPGEVTPVHTPHYPVHGTKYELVTQNMLRTHEKNRSLRRKKNPICNCSRSNQMP